jgi:hypothetical protein
MKEKMTKKPKKFLMPVPTAAGPVNTDASRRKYTRVSAYNDDSTPE